MEKKIYQVEIKHPETKEWVIPNDLFSFQVFGTKREAEIWVEKNINPTLTPYRILEYNESDIEGYTLIQVTVTGFAINIGWEEKHKGCSDPMTSGCTTFATCLSELTALDKLDNAVDDVRENILPQDLSNCDYEYDKKNMEFYKQGDRSYQLVYETEQIRLVYNIFMEEIVVYL